MTIRLLGAALAVSMSTPALAEDNYLEGWFEGNIGNHAAVARAIEEGDAKKARHAMEQVLGFTHSRLSRRQAGAGRRNGRPGGSRSVGKA
jgi:GntR family galactonate operon transcriptional repressor